MSLVKNDVINRTLTNDVKYNDPLIYKMANFQYKMFCFQSGKK